MQAPTPAIGNLRCDCLADHVEAEQQADRSTVTNGASTDSSVRGSAFSRAPTAISSWLSLAGDPSTRFFGVNNTGLRWFSLLAEFDETPRHAEESGDAIGLVVAHAFEGDAECARAGYRYKTGTARTALFPHPAARVASRAVGLSHGI